ncbi:MAG: hypothetical protein RI977_1027, partial [Bacteroidota bacterium]
STVFLLSYVTYHTCTEHTNFGGEGTVKYVYYFILATHIVLAAVVLPMVLYTMYYSTSGQFAKHKKWARVTFPKGDFSDMVIRECDWSHSIFHDCAVLCVQILPLLR